VVARSVVRVNGRSRAGVTGLNPDRGMNVSIWWVLCCQVEVSATRQSLFHSSLPSVVCLTHCD